MPTIKNLKQRRKELQQGKRNAQNQNNKPKQEISQKNPRRQPKIQNIQPRNRMPNSQTRYSKR